MKRKIVLVASLALAVVGCLVANLLAQAPAGGGAAQFKVAVVNIDAVFAKYAKATTYKKELDDMIAPFKGEAEKIKKQVMDIQDYLKHPNAEPYMVVRTALLRAHERNAKLGLSGERVRPWLQAFTLGKPPYGPDEIREQKRAVYDAGFDGWVLWHPGSKYELFLVALEKTTVSHKKPFTPAVVPSAATKGVRR